MNNKDFYEKALLAAFSGLMVKMDDNNRDSETIAEWAHEYALKLRDQRNKYLG